MSENLKVNANSSVLEHKRKHNLLVDAVPTKDTDGNYKIFENIIDSQGHKRFVEGVGVLNEPSYTDVFDNIYLKWSLSGSHLMLVFAGIIKNTKEITAYSTLVSFNLPDWIKEKIVRVWGPNIENKNIVARNTSWSTNLTIGVVLTKQADKLLRIQTTNGSALTATDDLGFRIAFDLLIDNEEPQPETQGE